ncbi:hypothetical protein [Bacteriovorax sp. Seq25_V]|uniref:hypothetical protein n=1 Tax=Bacteriovorax sp. Seq25_V TaxID=1201288 RepID=UPI000389F8EA|nr:hypothetical protein [Bacteriovorax sp. Seq25_V]EQC46583.1 hypothetical protein M900_2506 [Bacteriovorax sp. Seq25_V]
MNIAPNISTCFFTKQITLNNELRFKDHIDSCPSCKKKILGLLKNEELIKEHFNAYQISEEVEEQLMADLALIEKKIYPPTYRRALNSFLNFSLLIKVNSLSFLKNIFSAKNILWMAFAIGFYLITTRVINT